jgi:Group II intron, maturase-specific domain
MTYIVQRKDCLYVVAYDGLDPLTGKERRRWHPVGHDRYERKRSPLVSMNSATHRRRRPVGRSPSAASSLTPGCQRSAAKTTIAHIDGGFHFLGWRILRRLNPVLRGWTNYFRRGVSKATFGYLRAYTWAQVVNWLRRKHPRANWKWLRRRHLPGWWPTEGDTSLLDPNAVAISYARYRGQITDTTPWASRSIA